MIRKSTPENAVVFYPSREDFTDKAFNTGIGFSGNLCRGVACNNGYEFSYGGVANYGIDRLIQDMNQDSRLQQALQDASVTAVGIGMNQQEDVFYYDVILISE